MKIAWMKQSQRSLRTHVVGASAIVALFWSVLISSPSGALLGNVPPTPGSSTGWSVSYLGSGIAAATDVALDNAGHLFVTDFDASQVLRMNIDGTHQHSVGTGFDSPMGVAVDSQGHVFVADLNHQRIVEMNADGSNEHAIATGLGSPSGIAVDNLGHVFFCDQVTNSVSRMNEDGSHLITIAFGLNSPYRLSVDRSGHVYVADTNHSLIVEMNADGSNRHSVGSGFNRPEGTFADLNGAVFVGDYSNGRVAMIAPDGTTSTILATSNGVQGLVGNAAGTLFMASSGLNSLEVLRANPAAVRLANAATISWSEPFNSGAPVSSFTVTAYPANGASISATFPGSARSGTIYGLQDGVTYTAGVVATNSFGSSAESARSNPVTPGPGLPSLMSAPHVVAKNANALVTWQGAANGGSPLQGYIVTATNAGLTQFTSTFSSSATSGVIYGLVDGTTYKFTVQAVNAVGVADRSAATSAEPVGPPSWPYLFTPGFVAGVKKVTLSWSAALADGYAVTGYKVTASPGGHSCSTLGATSCTVSALNSGTLYSFSVVAKNKLGSSYAHAIAKVTAP